VLVKVEVQIPLPKQAFITDPVRVQAPSSVILGEPAV
jgi:hypothetical protein